MTLYKNKYRVDSARLKDWDYSHPGIYFITVCTKNRGHYFGHIMDGKMILSDTGKIADQYWREIPVHFSNVIIDEYVVMPNHIHGIINIVENVETKHTIGLIINQYKRICTISINEFGFEFGWQSRFHDHIIKDEKDLFFHCDYIINNPQNWESDDENAG
jgi:putative transposase